VNKFFQSLIFISVQLGINCFAATALPDEVRRIKGDINFDGVADDVYVNSGNDDGKRSLYISFNDKKLNGSKVIIYKNFIPVATEQYQTEPLVLLEISNKGILKIGLEYFLSAGSWDTHECKYSFKLVDNRLMLVGFDKLEISRNTGDYEERSFNFITKKTKIVFGSHQKNSRLEKWSNINNSKDIYIDDIVSPILCEIN